LAHGRPPRTTAPDDPERLVRHHAARAVLAIRGIATETADAGRMVCRVMSGNAARRDSGTRDALTAIAGRTLSPPCAWAAVRSILSVNDRWLYRLKDPGQSGPGRRIAMTAHWQYQVRFDLHDPEMAESLRRKLPHPSLALLVDRLERHRAAPKCQFDAFADYVAEAEAHSTGDSPLYAWTKATIENPAKKEKYLKSFTLYVEGHEVYAREIADALEADLQPFAASGLITRLSKYDSNPANNPQPPAR
jgi:hypothetical protein